MICNNLCEFEGSKPLHIEILRNNFKHAFIVVQNKQLQNQVIAQKAQKAALVTQIEGLDHRMAALEDAVGTD